MANYLAKRFELGKMNYNDILAIERYMQFKGSIDSILAEDGYKVNADGTVTKKEAEK